jgi:hypothetical protein
MRSQMGQHAMYDGEILALPCQQVQQSRPSQAHKHILHQQEPSQLLGSHCWWLLKCWLLAWWLESLLLSHVTYAVHEPHS